MPVRTSLSSISRRAFLQLGMLSCAFSSATLREALAHQASPKTVGTLMYEVAYDEVSLMDCGMERQFQQTLATLLSIDNNDILKPFRSRANLPAPGAGLGGWYDNNPDYNWKDSGSSVGFAPGHCFGQWLSALARSYKITGSELVLIKLKTLVEGYEKTVGASFFQDLRFPAYTYDKLLCGLLDVYMFTSIPGLLKLIDRLTDVAEPYLPYKVVDRLEPVPGHPERDESYRWDESYTLPESLFRAYQATGSLRYFEMARRFMDDETLFVPLSHGLSPLMGKHAYSYFNALNSAVSAYFATDNHLYLSAAREGFKFVKRQSFATGGWGPDETFVIPEQGELRKSLQKSHNSFETCGAYAHMRLTRALLQITRDSSYGDSLEEILYNTALGALPLQADGSAFYYSDYNFNGQKRYYQMKCPCCAGSLPELVADYRKSIYFKEKDGIFVNLYVPSTVHYEHKGIKVSLVQKTEYPLDSKVKIEFKTDASSVKQSIALRIPAWAQDSILSVNGEKVSQVISPGSIHSLSRDWKNGDLVTLVLPLKNRLESLSNENPELCALRSGPLALMKIRDSFDSAETFPFLPEQVVLSAKQLESNRENWEVEAANRNLRFKPFFAIADEHYSLYVRTR